MIDRPSLYNCIIGRTGLAQLGATYSTSHLKLRYHAKDGIIASLNGNIEAAQRCFLQTNKTQNSVSQSSKSAEDKGKATASSLDANLTLDSPRKTLRNIRRKRRIRSTRNFLGLFPMENSSWSPLETTPRRTSRSESIFLNWSEHSWSPSWGRMLICSSEEQLTCPKSTLASPVTSW